MMDSHVQHSLSPLQTYFRIVSSNVLLSLGIFYDRRSSSEVVLYDAVLQPKVASERNINLVSLRKLLVL